MITFRQALLYVFSFALLVTVLVAAQTNAHKVPVLKQIEFRNKTSALIQKITANLSEAEGCELALGGRHVTPGQSDILLLSEPFPMHKGQEVEDGVILEEMTMASGPADMKIQMKGMTTPMTRHPASLQFLLRSKDGKIRANWQQSPTGEEDLGIRLYVWLDSASKIVSCFSPQSAAAFCNSLNGFYDGQGCKTVMKVVSPLAADPLLEAGAGTCRYFGFQKHCPLGQVSQASCFTGRCLAAQELCQKCE